MKTILALIETGDLTITGSARASALADFGYDAPQIVATIRRLKESHLYKSMTSHRDHRLWQDVYRLEVEGLRIYLKLQIQDNRAIVVSFKQEDET